MTEEQKMVYGEQVADFLASEAWGETERELRDNFARRFRAAENPDKAILIWSQMRALDEVISAMGLTKQKGEIAKIEQDKKRRK